MDMQPPRGMRDFGPQEKIFRDEILDKIRKNFRIFGFSPLETPVVERYEVLSAKYAGGAEILKETFRLADQGGRELGLRYDLTVPLARYMANNSNVKLPFKRYAIGTVYRDGPIKLGRYREFYQCDCDIVGADSAAADAECIMLALAVFDSLELQVTTTINNIALLKKILSQEGVEKTIEAMLSLDKLKKIGEGGVREELSGQGMDPSCVDGLLEAARGGSNEEKVAFLREKYGEMEEIKRVEEVLALASDKRVVFDPSLSRGLSYYTGMVFETYAVDGEVKGSLSAGGRYDEMIGAFIGRKEDFPAVGISFGLEPIMETLRSSELKRSTTKAFVIPIKTAKEAGELTKKLRSAGIHTEIDLLDRSISKNLDYANSLSIPYVILVGSKELLEGRFTLKDMGSGEEKKLSSEDLIKELT